MAASRSISNSRVSTVVKRVSSGSPDDASALSSNGGSKAASNSSTPGTDTSGSLFNPSEGYLTESQWSTSFSGVGAEPFDARIVDILMSPIDEADIEIKPDGLIYLPEIKYRRILNRAFGPGGWGLIPRGAHSVTHWICLGRFISQARGEQDFFDEGGLATATEGCKSNALMRCCKDLGIASELWDPAFVSQFKAKHCVEEWVTHATKGNKKRMWRLASRQWEYPWAKK
ncbi:mitochondrial genome maintenance MGM101 [Linderina pennispora]|uniref:Mitochondrial genome maintenance protein MGM101 n=1 Tax=Linderina pennispora TaxID=61395 RepID=A0A1Y1WJL6_9FUNG|nr:mitochondrial genome maintenance MGM101 [Linderina pennispora]ORX73672.1 mitochondrial genome maintenance MGM101 [Linderina pennispora]